MFKIDVRLDKPIYEQIIDNIKELVFKDILKAEEKLPSVRQMASILSINPNTVSKAYKELENQGIIYTLRGKGTFVSEENNDIDQDRLKESLENLKSIAIELGHLGVGKDEIKIIIDEIYVGKEDSND